MKHEDEICRWARMPVRTEVWFRNNHSNRWLSTSCPGWENDFYIIDDQWAELRKAQTDGKQLQYKEDLGLWKDTTFTNEDINTLFGRWRIKPKPVYEWQWTYLAPSGRFEITLNYYAETDITELDLEKGFMKFEPSKRERK